MNIYHRKNRGGILKSFAIVRGKDRTKVKIALHDMEHYGSMRFSAKPRRIEPSYADNLLVRVVGVPLRTPCKVAALVELENNAGAAISKLRKIHPPAHIVIVSPRHSPYNELMECVDIYPEFEMESEMEVSA